MEKGWSITSLKSKRQPSTLIIGGKRAASLRARVFELSPRSVRQQSGSVDGRCIVKTT